MGSWETTMDLNRVCLLQPAKPMAWFGLGALAKLDGILAELAATGRDNVLVVTDPVAYKACGAWDTVRPLLDSHVTWAHYDNVRPNPTYGHCEAAAKVGRQAGVKAVLGIGGGSAIDTAKTAAVLLRHPGRKASDFYERGVPVSDALPIIAINTSHGTGSECGAFAVAQSDGEEKPAIYSSHLCPTWTIEDPRLTTTLPLKQTVATGVDAFTHAVEAATTVTASPYVICLAKEAVRLITANLPVAITQPGNLTARYWLMYASAIAGIAFNLGMLHITHALEHAMSALNADITHGEGLGMLLPAVVREIYPAAAATLADVLSPIAPGLTGVPGETEQAVAAIKAWFTVIGQSTCMALYFTGADVPALSRMAMKSSLGKMLLPLAPIRVDSDVVERIFQHAL